MVSNASPGLLASYLAVVERQIDSGRGLSERSDWAIAHARRQLQAAHDVLVGNKQFLAPASSAGLREAQATEAAQLARMVLEARGAKGEALEGKGMERSEREAAESIYHMIEDLDSLSAADEASAREAARRVSSVFA